MKLQALGTAIITANFSLTKRVFLTLLILIAALLVSYEIRNIHDIIAYQIFLAAVGFVAFTCGTWLAVGTYATILGLLLSPATPYSAPMESDFFRVIIFAFLAPLSILIFYSLRRATKLAAKATQALRESEERLNEATAATGVGVWQVDVHTKASWRTPSHDLAYGRAYDPSRGVDEFMSYVFEEDRTRVRVKFDRALRSGSTYADEYRVKWPDGSLHWLAVRGGPTRDSAGELTGLIGTIINITERKASEEALRTAEATAKFERKKVETILDAVPTMITRVDRYERFIFQNKTNAEFFDKDGTLIGKSMREFFGECAYNEIRPYVEAVRSGKQVQFEWASASSAEAGVQHYLVTYTPEFDVRGHTQGFVSTVINIQEIKRAREEAELANRAKTYFLANMSHEIRTPLGVIQGYADLLSEKPLDPDSKAMLGTISRNTRQLTEIIGEILDVTKIEAGKVEVEKLRVSLQDIISDIQSALSFRAAQKGIEFRTIIIGRPPKHIITDPTRLKQILINLGGNAIKFTNQGHVEIRIECNALNRDGCEMLKITVEDTGIGITPNAKEKLFKPFSQADASTTRKFGGTGLGLYISRTLARGLGGDLELVRSEPGNGSCFQLTVQITGDEHTKDYVQGNETKGPRAHRLNKTRILLVEDSLDNQALIKRLLQNEGASADLANNGQEGCAKAMAGDYDLVLMDIQMPVLDGWGAVKCLRDENFTKPVVALTAHALTEERERSSTAGFNDYLTKPVDRELIVTAIQHQLERVP